MALIFYQHLILSTHVDFSRLKMELTETQKIGRIATKVTLKGLKVVAVTYMGLGWNEVGNIISDASGDEDAKRSIIKKWKIRKNGTFQVRNCFKMSPGINVINIENCMAMSWYNKKAIFIFIKPKPGRVHIFLSGNA